MTVTCLQCHKLLNGSWQLHPACLKLRLKQFQGTVKEDTRHMRTPDYREGFRVGYQHGKRNAK